MAAKVDTPALVSLAQHFIGQPYKWGGSSPATGFDCSGFVQWLYAQAGVKLPRVTYDQVNAGVSVPKGQLQAGDIVFFEPTAQGPGHEGLYVGGGKFIEAPHTGADIRVSSLAGRTDYVTARRVVPNGVASLPVATKVAQITTGVTAPSGRAPAAATAPPGPTGNNTDALAALLLSQQFQPPQVDQVGTTANPVVHTEATNPPDAVDALSLARQFLDASKGAFTNPGFAQYLHGLNGTQLPSSTIAQSAAGTHTPTPSAGDVAFFGSPPTHQAVMLDGEHALHATNGGTVLRVSSLAHPTYAGGLTGIRNYA